MATYTAATYTMDMSVTANFNALMGDIDAKITSLGGWSYVSQTGDINPASVAAPSAGSYAGFRLYSTTIGSQTWYVRIDFGRSAGNGAIFKVQCGTGANGSGTLTGQTSTQVVNIGDSDTGTNRSLHVAAATGRMMVCVGLNQSDRNKLKAWSFHGSVDNTGAMNGNMEQFTVFQQSFTAQAIPTSGTVPTQWGTWPAPITLSSSNSISGTIALFIPQLFDANGGYNPTLACMLYGASDIGINVSTTVSLYSTMRTYITTACNFTFTGSVQAALRFD